MIRLKDVNKKHPLYDGVVMCPTTHDITPVTLPHLLVVFKNLLSAGNKVLIVSKPRLECIKVVCSELEQWKKQILFRFTIGCMDDQVLKFWEPNATNYGERKAALIWVRDHGFATSVSSEPLLDPSNVLGLVKDLEPYVTDSIWIGKMNNIDSRVKVKTESEKAEVEKVRLSEKQIQDIYDLLKGNPKVKWKDSLKKVLGLKQATTCGQDI